MMTRKPAAANKQASEAGKRLRAAAQAAARRGEEAGKRAVSAAAARGYEPAGSRPDREAAAFYRGMDEADGLRRTAAKRGQVAGAADRETDRTYGMQSAASRAGYGVREEEQAPARRRTAAGEGRETGGAAAGEGRSKPRYGGSGGAGERPRPAGIPGEVYGGRPGAADGSGGADRRESWEDGFLRGLLGDRAAQFDSLKRDPVEANDMVARYGPVMAVEDMPEEAWGRGRGQRDSRAAGFPMWENEKTKLDAPGSLPDPALRRPEDLFGRDRKDARGFPFWEQGSAAADGRGGGFQFLGGKAETGANNAEEEVNAEINQKAYDEAPEQLQCIYDLLGTDVIGPGIFEAVWKTYGEDAMEFSLTPADENGEGGGIIQGEYLEAFEKRLDEMYPDMSAKERE